MTIDEALEVLRCSRDADRAAMQRQYDERYNELQRLRETATTREERQDYVGKLQAVETAYAFLMDLVGFGPVAAPEPELQQILQESISGRPGSPKGLRGPRQSVDVPEQPRQAARLVWDQRRWRFLLLTLFGVVVLGGLGLVVQQLVEQYRAQQAAQDRLKQQLAEQQQTRQAEQQRLKQQLTEQQAAQDRLKQQLAEQQQTQQAEQQRLKQQAEQERLKQQALPPPPTHRNSIGMDFVLVPAGSFTMGSTDRGHEGDEQPLHRVTISKPFYLGKYEVTQGQWQAVMGKTPSRYKNPKRPVEQVSWDDVQAFIRTLNAKEGGTRYRLPTEAEWEYAARAGSTTAYSFGDDKARLGDYAWYMMNSGVGPQDWTITHLVGQKRANAWGLHDMYGNVQEWVQDWYGAYTSAAASDPTGPLSGSARVLRGGDIGGTEWHCRSAFREAQEPDYRYHTVGFRLLRLPQ